MRFDDLYLWYLADPSMPRYIGALKLVAAGKGVSLHYGSDWLAHGFALREDLPLVDTEHAPPGRLAADQARAVGAVDDARPDRWGEKVIRYIDKPKRHSLMEYLYYAGDDLMTTQDAAANSQRRRSWQCEGEPGEGVSGSARCGNALSVSGMPISAGELRQSDNLRRPCHYIGCRARVFGPGAAGAEIAEQFGKMGDNLPLDALCRKIDIDPRKSLGQPRFLLG